MKWTVARPAKVPAPNDAMVQSLVTVEQNPIAMNTKDDKSKLNDIHDLLVDSRKGYMKAAENAEDPRIKSLLTKLSVGRLALMEDLLKLRVQNDPEANMDDGGTIKGDLHRTWIDVRDALSSSDNANVLHECERGEQYLLDAYEVEPGDVTPQTFDLFQRQRATVASNMVQIKALAKSFEQVER